MVTIYLYGSLVVLTILAIISFVAGFVTAGIAFTVMAVLALLGWGMFMNALHGSPAGRAMKYGNQNGFYLPPIRFGRGDNVETPELVTMAEV